MAEDDMILKVIAEIRSGFNEFEHRFSKRIYNLIHKKLSCEEDAEELTEDVLCWMFIHLCEFKKESSLWTFIQGVTDNMIGTFLKHKFRKRQLQMVCNTEANEGSSTFCRRMTAVQTTAYIGRR